MYSLKTILESSRYIVVLGIAGTFLASVALFVFGFAGVIYAIIDTATMHSPLAQSNLKDLSIDLIQTIDIFLLATVLYIIGMGLYELFIDDALKLPSWLEVKTLDDLKSRLLGVVAVILPVTFLGILVDWKQGISILWVGIAVAVVMLAIAALQLTAFVKKRQ